MGVEHGNLLVVTPSKEDSPLPPQATPNQLFSEIKMIFFSTCTVQMSA